LPLSIASIPVCIIFNLCVVAFVGRWLLLFVYQQL
jgi:hypothetical protein